MMKGLSKVMHSYRYALVSAFAVLAFTVVGNARTYADVAGQVGNAPRCSVNAIGTRGKAFQPAGDSTTVRFKVTGPDDCRVQLSTNSFYAPSIDGRPYAKQILYQRATTNYKPGTYSATIGLPTNGSDAKGCYYQVDLTYGIHNVTPLLAYDHGKICKPQPTPQPTLTPTPQPQAALACANLTQTLVRSDDNTYAFTANATASNTTITNYVFNFGDGNSQTVTTDQLTARTTHTFGTGNNTYAVQVVVNGQGQPNVTSANCQVSVNTTTQVAECRPGVPEGSAECNPQQPSVLPNTGAGDVIGFFGLTAVAGGIFHHFFIRRKFNG